MRAKLIVLYSNIKDPKEFDEYYKNVHIPMAKKIPEVGRSLYQKSRELLLAKQTITKLSKCILTIWRV